MTDEPPDGDDNAADSRRTETAAGEDVSRGLPASVLELDEVFAALGHARRRYLLYTLVDGSSEETLPELAVKIAAWEQDKSISEVTDEERRRVHISLYHSHIPKLVDLDVLEYDEGENVIVRALNTEQVQAVLEGAGAELDDRQEKHAQRKRTGESDDVEESE